LVNHVVVVLTKGELLVGPCWRGVGCGGKGKTTACPCISLLVGKQVAVVIKKKLLQEWDP